MKNSQKTIFIPTLVVFLAVLAVVGISFLMSQSGAQREVDTEVVSYAETAEGDIIDRIRVFEETLWAGTGIFAGNDNVTKPEWTQFINTSAVMKRYPGARAVGYVRLVDQAETGNVMAWSQNTLPPNFKIYPEGQREQYAPILYLEPDEDNNSTAIGFDTLTSEPRAKAMHAARDTGQMAMSEEVTSNIQTDGDPRTFVLYTPQYQSGQPTSNVEERRRAIEGYVFASFRVQAFMDNAISVAPNEAIGLRIITPSNGKELYKDDNFDTINRLSDHRARISEIQIGGNTLAFTYVYDVNNVLDESVLSRPVAILIFGIITAFLIATAVWLILRGKANELLLEQERDINEAKDNLLSLASHQLRTPATGVKQYVGLLLQGFAGDITETQQGLLDKAYSANERQLKTINDILYMARLGSGRVVLSKSNFAIDQLIENILDEVKDDIAKKNHTITKKIKLKRKYFYGDEHMIRMVVENLLSNAIKYTPDGGKIKIETQHDKDFTVTVTDNGVGIPLEQQHRMFRQFERIENDLSIAVGGSGIGLYVVQNIAELHGGKIEVMSDGARGSTFTLRLPSSIRSTKQ